MRTRYLNVFILWMTCIFASAGFSAALFSDVDAGAPKAVQPIAPSILMEFLPGEVDAALGKRLSETEVTLDDLYAVAASELAYKAAEHRDDFRDLLNSYRLRRDNPGIEVKVLTADFLTTFGIPPIFAGWNVVGILDTTNKSPLQKTDLYGLTLESPEGLRMMAIRGTDKKSLDNLLIDCGVFVNGGDMEATIREMQTHLRRVMQRRYFYTSALVGISADMLGLSSALKNAQVASQAYVQQFGAVTGAVSMGSEQLKEYIADKVTASVLDADEFYRESNPDKVAGHSLGGILASVVRAREIIAGRRAHKKVQVTTFNSMGTLQLIPTICNILGKSVADIPALEGADLALFREVYRENDVVGFYGRHIGRRVQLGSVIPQTLAPAPAPAGAGAGTGGDTPLAVEVPSPVMGSDGVSAALAPGAGAEAAAVAVSVSSDGTAAGSLVFAEVLAGGGAAATGGAAGSSVGVDGLPAGAPSLSYLSRISTAASSGLTAIGSATVFAANATARGVISAANAATSGVSSAASAATAALQSVPNDLLADHACSPMMRELFMAYAHQQNRIDPLASRIASAAMAGATA